MSRLLQQVAKKPQPDGVRHLRTTARRIEALIEALAPEPARNERKLLKHLAKLRRRAGRVRDVDVQIALLRALKIGRDAARKERLLNALSDRRAIREKELAGTLDKQKIREVRKRLKKAGASLSLFAEPPSRDGAPACVPFDPVATSLRMFACIARAQGTLREQNLHDYRVETKRVRYVAEMAGEDTTAERIVSELKRMQDAIGEWHDWLELTGRAHAVLNPDQESPLISALDNITRAKLREAIAVCTEVRNNMLESTRQITPPKKRAAGVRDADIAATA